MEYTKSGEWKLTDREIEGLTASGYNIAEAQEAKKKAYIEAGGVILNPDALTDLYEALIGLAACFRNIEILPSVRDENEKHWLGIAIDTMIKALAKAKLIT